VFMKKTIFEVRLWLIQFLFVGMICLSVQSWSQPIMSTGAGGLWIAPTTWIGNTVPSPSDFVILNGPVSVPFGVSCGTLIISSLGTLNMNTDGVTFTTGSIFFNGGTLNFSNTNTTVNVFGGVTMNGGLIQGNGTTRTFNAGSLLVPSSQTATMQNVVLSVTGSTQIDGTLIFNNGNSASKKFGGGLTISSTGTFTNTAQNVPISIGGNMANNGTFSQGTGMVTFTGATSNTITGTATTTAFDGGIDIDKGTSQSNILDVQCVITMPIGGLILNNGTFKLSSASTIVPFTIDPNFPSTAGLWCNGGTMTSTVNWTFDGTVQVSAGTVTIGATADINLTPNSNSAGTLNVSGGVLNVAGRIGGSTDFNYIQSGGTVTLATVGCTSLSPFNMNTSSSFTMTGGTMIIESPNGNAGFTSYSATGAFTGGTLQLGDGATPASKTISVDCSFPVYNLNVNSANVTGGLTNQGLTVANDFTISSGAFTANSLDLTVNGDWTNNGIFTPTGATVILSGGALQTISGTSATSFNNLTVNNTVGVIPAITANTDLTVTNILTMTSGTINLGGNTFSLSNNNTGALVHGLTSASGWMYGGVVSRAFSNAAIAIANADGLVPIGTSKDFRPFFFSKTNGSGTNGTISMTHSDPGTTSKGLSIDDGGNTIIIRNNSQWSSTLTGGTGATFLIRYGGTGLGTVANLNDIRSMLLNSTIATHVTATTVSLTDPRAERSGLTDVQMSNDFFIGSTNTATSLPIVLQSFMGSAQRDRVDLKWITASELNNDYFTILRSATGNDFEEIARIKGNGTTNQMNTYLFEDEGPATGRNYYRLIQTDFDGKTTFSEVIIVSFSGENSSVNIFPNPVSISDKLSVEIKNLNPDSPVTIRIANMQGLTVGEVSVKTDDHGTLKTNIAPTTLPAGIYLLEIQGIGRRFIVK